MKKAWRRQPLLLVLLIIAFNSGMAWADGIEKTELVYRAGDGRVNVTLSVAVADEDDDNLESARIRIADGYEKNQDILLFVEQNGISGQWDEDSGTLVLTGTSSIENYQAALRNIRFENSAQKPKAGLRTVSFEVDDGEDKSNIVSRNINIVAENEPPVLSGIETSDIEYAGKVKVTSSVAIADSDNPNLMSAVIKISNGYVKGQDVISFTNANGITGTWDADKGELLLSGEASLENYQLALRAVEFETSPGPNAGTKTVSFAVNDGTDPSNTVTRKINVPAVNQPPVLAALESDVLNYDKGDGKVNITSALTVSDPGGANLSSALVKIESGYVNGEDLLSFADANGIVGAWNAATGTLSLTGEAAVSVYQSALRSVQFENNSSHPTSGTRKISFVVNDGDLNSNNVSRDITINYNNVPPVLSGIENSNLLILFDNEFTLLTSNISVNDIDNSLLSSATVKISEGYRPGEDILAFAESDNISSVWDQNTGTLTLSGQSTIFNYQKALRNIRYNNHNKNPSTVPRVVSFVVNDGNLSSNDLQRELEFNARPMVENISISGVMSVCKEIKGSYSYSDPENDAEDYSSFRWLRANTPDAPDNEKTVIPGAVSLTYTLTEEDQDKFIFFEVTPKAGSGSVLGNPYLSGSTVKISNLLPTVSFAGTTAICEGASTNLTISITGTPPFELIYTDGKKNFELKSSQPENTISVSGEGTYKGVSLTDNLGCEVTDLPSTVDVAVKPNPLAEIIGLNNAYSLRSAPVPLQGSPAGGVFSGKGVLTPDNTFSPSLAGLEGSPHPVVYTYVDNASGCAGTDTVNVEIVDADASIAGLRSQNQYCNIDVPTLITGVNVAGSNGTFAITGDVGLIDHKNNTATLNTNNLTPGNYTISYSYTQNGTQQTVYENIEVIFVDNVIVSGLEDATYCNSEGLIALGANYQGGVFGGSGIDSSNNTFFFNPGKVQPGNTSIFFKVTNSNGCVITDTIPVVVLASTKPRFMANSNCWTANPIRFENTTTGIDSVQSWSWQFGESASSSNTSALKDPVHQYAEPGNYQVTLVATNLNNCTDTVTEILNLGHKPVAAFEWDKPCALRNESMHINNTSVSVDSIVHYLWTIVDPSGRKTDYKTQTISNNFKWDSVYTVKLRLGTEYGCSDSVTRTFMMSSPITIKDSVYFENFDRPLNSWNIETVSENNWKWELPHGTVSTAHSGPGALFSDFTVGKDAKELVVTSPCFDFTGVERPFVEVWINSAAALNEEGVVMQFNAEGAESWAVAGNTDSGVNWYNSDNIGSFTAPDKDGWTGNTNGWIKANLALDEVANKRNVRMRMVYKPQAGTSAGNMFAFDDVTIGNRIRTSLFENFTNLGSSGSLAAIQVLNSVLAEAPKDVVSLQYHTSFPGSDSINTDNTADPGARVLNYGIGAVPVGLLNGGTSSDLSFDFVSRKPAYNDIISQSLTSTPFLLSITAEKATDNIRGKVLVSAMQNYVIPDLVLYIVVVEDLTIQTGGGNVFFYNVVKKFIPSAGGTSLKDDWLRGELIEVPFSWTFTKVYNPEKVKVVAFVQSNATREVFQASSNEVTIITSAPPLINNGSKINNVTLAPNPATNTARLFFRSSLENMVKIEIHTMNGRVLMSDKIHKGADVYEINTSDLVNGLYLIKLLPDDGNVTILKLTVNR